MARIQRGGLGPALSGRRCTEPAPCRSLDPSGVGPWVAGPEANMLRFAVVDDDDGVRARLGMVAIA
jgi:hypothetical protein